MPLYSSKFKIILCSTNLNETWLQCILLHDFGITSSTVFSALSVLDATVFALHLSNITVYYLTKSLFSPVIVTILLGHMECSKFDIELNSTSTCIFNSFGISIDVICLCD